MDAKSQKEELLDVILNNPTYTPDAQIIINLRERLLRLPVDCLRNLKLVLEQKDYIWPSPPRRP